MAAWLAAMLATAACGGSEEAATPTVAPAIPSVGEPASSTAPVIAAVERPGAAVAIAQGAGFGCALRRNGRVACWGQNEEGQLGQAHSDPIEGAVHVAGIDDAVAVAASLSTACAARRSGAVVCWGDARNGALGTGRELIRRGVGEVPGPRDATALFAGTGRFCALTPTGAYCWGLRDGRVDGVGVGAPFVVPTRIVLEDVASLELGLGRRFAFLRNGSAVAWDYASDPSPIDGVVSALSESGLECLVRADGEVTCAMMRGGSGPVVSEVVPSLRGASTLVLGPGPNTIVGLLEDGTLARFARYGGDAESLADARELTSITSGGGSLLALTRDGRVREWGHVPARDGVYTSREITLPDPPDALATPPAPTDASLPRWCGIALRVVSPSITGTLESVVRAAVDEETSIADGEAWSDALCISRGIEPGSLDCPPSGPWFAERADGSGSISLVAPLGAGQVGALPELALHSDGTEESLLIDRLALRSSQPVDAWLEVMESSRVCDHGMCGFIETRRVHVVVTGLGGERFLITEARIDTERAGRAAPDLHVRSLPAARVQVSGARVDVWVCGGHAQLALPSAAVDPTSDAPALTSVSAEEAAAAAQRCNDGWSRFGNGDLAGARTEIDAALVVLEHARDERGLRALGACLYNRGRIAEQDGAAEDARAFYQRSLTARPSPTVAARLESLVER